MLKFGRKLMIHGRQEENNEPPNMHEFKMNDLFPVSAS